MDNQSNNQDVLEALSEFSTHIDEKFDKIEKTMATKEYVDEKFKKIDERFNKLDERFNKIEGTVVTKIYLEDKLNEKFGELRADLVTLTRKEDQKLGTTVELLEEKHVFTKDETKSILAMEPFPKVSI